MPRARRSVSHSSSGIPHPASQGARSRPRPGAPAFTLLELVVVLTIMAAAAALVVPALSDGLRPWRVREAVRGVATVMKFARNQAVVRRVPLQVVLDRTRNAYWLDSADARVLSDPERAASSGIRLYPLPPGFRFGRIALGGLQPEEERIGIVFFPTGSSMGGSVEVVDDRGRGHRISIQRLTGQARVE